MNEVREQVFKYIPVIARPLVLQGMMHPVTWTPAYADTTVSLHSTQIWTHVAERCTLIASMTPCTQNVYCIKVFIGDQPCQYIQPEFDTPTQYISAMKFGFYYTGCP